MRLTIELRAIMAAVVFFTRLPAPSRPLLDAEDMRRAATWWPLIGLATGSTMAAAWWLASRLWPPLIASGFALAAGLLTTGALEQDGVADVAGGLAAGATRDRILETMHESRIGAAGVIALAIMTGLRWQALAALPVALVPAILLTSQALSRAAAAGLMALLPYLRGPDSRARAVVGRLPPARLATATAIGLASLALLPPAIRPVATLTAVAALAACAIWFRWRLGGYTGDCVGATQQIVELALLLAPLATP